MDRLTSQDLRELLNDDTKHCVSLYMTVERTFAMNQSNPVQLRNLLNTAEEQLIEYGLRSTTAREILAEARSLVGENSFWAAPGDGVAMFISPRGARILRLPTHFPPTVHVNDRFSIKPLLPYLSQGESYFVLALSQNRVRLLGGGQYGLEEIDVAGLPKDMNDALGYDNLQESVQAHTAEVTSIGGSRGTAIFHGHGSQPDAMNQFLDKYLRIVDEALHPVLNTSTGPLVFAGVEYLFPIFRRITRRKHLCDESVIGNPDRLSAAELHAAAWPIAAHEFAEERRKMAERFEKSRGAGLAADRIETILPAAREGRVAALFVASQAEVWGNVDPASGEIDCHLDRQEEDADLVELAAIDTLEHGGDIFASDGDQTQLGSPVAAVFRY